MRPFSVLVLASLAACQTETGILDWANTEDPDQVEVPSGGSATDADVWLNALDGLPSSQNGQTETPRDHGADAPIHAGDQLVVAYAEFQSPVAVDRPAGSAADTEAAWTFTASSLDDGRAHLRNIRHVVDAARASLPPNPGRSVASPWCTGSTVAWANGRAFDSVTSASRISDPDAVVLICPGVHPAAAAGPSQGRSTRVYAPLVPGTRPTLTSIDDDHIVKGGGGSFIAVVGLTLSGGDAAVSMSWGGTLIVGDVRFEGQSKRPLTVHQADLFVLWGSDLDGSQANAASDVTSTVALVVNNEIHDHDAKYAGTTIAGHFAAFVGNDIHDNTADYEAGGLGVLHGIHNLPLSVPPFMALVGNHFERNHAGYEGGALELGIRWTELQSVLIGNTYIDNTSPRGPAITGGPGGGSITIVGDTFVGQGPESNALDFGGWDPFTLTKLGLTFQ